MNSLTKKEDISLAQCQTVSIFELWYCALNTHYTKMVIDHGRGGKEGGFCD